MSDATIPIAGHIEPELDVPVSYSQIEKVVRMLLKEGYHIVPATENTTRVALRPREASSLFILQSQ